MNQNSTVWLTRILGLYLVVQFGSETAQQKREEMCDNSTNHVSEGRHLDWVLEWADVGHKHHVFRVVGYWELILYNTLLFCNTERFTHNKNTHVANQYKCTPVHVSTKFKCKRLSRLALPIATCANGATNFSLAKLF